jgi:hypothetical protein
VAGKRKLFLTHAGELAHLLLRDVGRDGLVAQFVRSYAERYRREGLLSDPARLPEFETTIGREMLLVIAGCLRRHLSREFEVDRYGALRPDEGAFINAFYVEFLVSLIRGFKWSAAEAADDEEMFRRDLDMYRRWGERPDPLTGVARLDEGQSPFPDRCALLLDPAMMEQARRAAAEFEKEILLTAARRFHQLGRSDDIAMRPARRPTKKSASRPKKSPASAKAAQPSPRKSPGGVQKQGAARSSRTQIPPVPKRKPLQTSNSAHRKQPKAPSRRSTRG